MAFILILITFSNILGLLSCSSAKLNGFCGQPVKPYKSQLLPLKEIFTEEESITYKCDDYISLKQYRKCVKGKWRGDPPVCGNAFRDNDVKWAKVFNRKDGSLIREYNTTVLSEFSKFGNSFIAERYGQPLRAFGANNYRIELFLQRKAVFQLVRISLSLVNHLVDSRLKDSHFNITDVRISPFRECRLHTQSNVSPWLHNSTRFDFWYSCESKGKEFFDIEINYQSDKVVIETESNDELKLDLATFILAQPYLTNANLKEPICGLPEVPVGLEYHVLNDNSRYAFKCGKGFKLIDSDNANIPYHVLECVTDMKWKGKLPHCLPDKTCKKIKLNEKHLTEVYTYERVYYYNETDWSPIEGTKVYFKCKDETNIFVGKEYRECRDGYWSDSPPNCLETKESKMNFSNLMIIILTTLFLAFSLTAILIYCWIRMKRIRSNQIHANPRIGSNIYDDYDFNGMEGKAIDENYEAVDDDRYADNRQIQRTVPDAYTQMTEGYKYNYNDRNVYDDCGQYANQEHSQIPSDFEESYIVMKRM